MAVPPRAPAAVLRPPAGAHDSGVDLVCLSGHQVLLVQAKSTVRAAAALDRLNRAERAWRQLDHRADLSGHVGLITGRAGQGKATLLAHLVAGASNLLDLLPRPRVLARDQLLPVAERIDEALAVELVRTGGRPLTWQRALALAGRVVGLGRFARRHLKAALLALIRLRGSILTRHRDRLDAVGCRGRVFLRTALRSAGTRNAPPCGRRVRPFGETGSRSVPPLALAA
ncbi:hypothetical protein ACWC10_03320 [Streptomyces sp. NPDC001595]|uniref:hypothetical protein n=1 Tax=Streptomyces sp. NPDC001532 TaxID=3154520 RepID=UPI00331CF2F8